MAADTLGKLKNIVLEVLNENTTLSLDNENNREEIATKINERYINLVKTIAKDFLQKEIDKRSTLQTFQNLNKKF